MAASWAAIPATMAVAGDGGIALTATSVVSLTGADDHDIALAEGGLVLAAEDGAKEQDWTVVTRELGVRRRSKHGSRE